MADLYLEPDEYVDLMSLSETFGVLGTIMQEGGSPDALRMVVSGLHSAADLLERVLKRWEGS